MVFEEPIIKIFFLDSFSRLPISPFFRSIYEKINIKSIHPPLPLRIVLNSE